MYVHKKAKLCFLASPRTASRAVRNALQRIGFKQQGAHHDGPEQGYPLDGYVSFCAVRNHWDAAVSWWFNTRLNRKMDYPELEWFAKHFCQNDAYFRAGTMFWMRKYPSVITLRYENQERELNAILTAAGLPEVELPEFGVSEEREGRHYSTFYKSTTRQFVDWVFRPEIRELRYRFHEDPKWSGRQG
jgi:hypothetical protein